jgi:hypothetical protein
MMSKQDPSGNNKYLMWMADQFIKYSNNYESIVNIINKFHKVKNRLPKDKRDINKYKHLYQLKDELLKVPVGSKRQKRIEISKGAEKIYEDEEFIVLRVNTKEAACKYGSETKWCISGKEDNRFIEYSRRDNVFFYIIKKGFSKNDHDPLYKIAVATNKDGDFEIFDAWDDTISPAKVSDYLGEKRYDVINNRMLNSVTEEPSSKYNKELENGIKNKDPEILKTIQENDLDSNSSIILSLVNKKELRRTVFLNVSYDQLIVMVSEHNNASHDFTNEDLIAIIDKYYGKNYSKDNNGWNLRLAFKIVNVYLGKTDREVVTMRLVKLPIEQVREKIALRPNLPENIALMLAEDESKDVKMSLSLMTGWLSVFKKLMKDKDEKVVQYAKENLNSLNKRRSEMGLSEI